MNTKAKDEGLTAREEALLSNVLDLKDLEESEELVETESTSDADLSSATEKGDATESSESTETVIEEPSTTESQLLSTMLDKVTDLSTSLASSQAKQAELSRSLEVAKANLSNTASDNEMLLKAASKACRIYAMQLGVEKKDYSTMSAATLSQEFTALQDSFRSTMPEGRQSSVTTDNNTHASVTAFPVSKSKKA